MAEQPRRPGGESRHRVLRACEPCKTRKKRCDGTQPCATCVRFQYECYFSLESQSRLKRARIEVPTQEQPTDDVDGPSSKIRPEAQQHAERTGRQTKRSREAISYAGFNRILSNRLQGQRESDQSDHPKAFAPFSGVSTGGEPNLTNTLTSALSMEQMQRLAASFTESVHPVYTFIRPIVAQEAIASRFASMGTGSHDIVLLGIAALGSLFGDGFAATQETRHVTLARHLQCFIDAEASRTVIPSLNLIAALLLQTLYLRSVARPYATWISICTAMHSIAIMETSIKDLATTERYQDLCFEPRQMLWIARLLNTWIANEHGRPPVQTPIDDSLVPPMPSDPVSATPEEQMIYLYHISEALSPENHQSYPDGPEASIAKLAALEAQQCHDGVLLSRTIMAFCFYRLLRASETADLKKHTFTHLVEIGLDGLQAARRLAQDQKPWWHIANLPFQFLSAMLVMDTASSYAQIPAALQVFEDVAQAMPSSAITEALNLVKKLVALSRLQKTEQLKHLDQCPGSSSEHMTPAPNSTPSLESMQMQPPAAGLSVPWQMTDIEAGDGYDSLDWSFLPNIDIPIFDLNF